MDAFYDSPCIQSGPFARRPRRARVEEIARLKTANVQRRSRTPHASPRAAKVLDKMLVRMRQRRGAASDEFPPAQRDRHLRSCRIQTREPFLDCVGGLQMLTFL